MATVISAFDVVDFIFKAHESQSEDLQANGGGMECEIERVRQYQFRMALWRIAN